MKKKLKEEYDVKLGQGYLETNASDSIGNILIGDDGGIR